MLARHNGTARPSSAHDYHNPGFPYLTPLPVALAARPSRLSSSLGWARNCAMSRAILCIAPRMVVGPPAGTVTLPSSGGMGSPGISTRGIALRNAAASSAGTIFNPPPIGPDLWCQGTVPPPVVGGGEAEPPPPSPFLPSSDAEGGSDGPPWCSAARIPDPHYHSDA